MMCDLDNTSFLSIWINVFSEMLMLLMFDTRISIGNVLAGLIMVGEVW